MNQTATVEWVDGQTMHFRVAERMRTLPRTSDWRGRRDLGMLLTLSTLAPLAVCAIEVESPGVAIGGLMLAAVAAGVILMRWIKNEYVIEPLAVSSSAGIGSARRMGLIPHAHLGGRKDSTLTRTISSRRDALNS